MHQVKACEGEKLETGSRLKC